MTQRVNRFAAFALVFGLLMAFGLTADAPADAAPVDGTNRATPAVGGYDDDILIYDLDADTLIAEGWLKTAQSAKNPSLFIGTFTDNFAGGKTYSAIHDNGNALLTINTVYGKFVFNASNDAISYPKRFGSGANFSIRIKQHAYTIPTYNTFTMVSVVGGGTRTSGQMTLTIDGWNAVVPDNPKTHVVSRITGTTSSKNFVAPITQTAIFLPTTNSSSTYSLIFSARISGQTYRFQSYSRQVAGAWGIYDGFAYADGQTRHGVIYQWHIE